MKFMYNSYSSSSMAVFLLRIILGVIFIAHGGQKVFGWFGGGGLEGTAAFFGNIGIPVFFAYIVAFVEFFGGLFVLFGFFTRVSALAISMVMLVAVFHVHLPNFFVNNGGVEFPLTLFFVALVIVLLGPGVYSIDNRLFNKEI